MHSVTLFRLEELFATVPQWLTAAYEGLPKDKYIPSGYRSRRFSRFLALNGKIELLPHAGYTQDKVRGYNTLLGNVERWFEPIEPEVANCNEFRQMIRSVLQLGGVTGPRTAVNVHFIRNACAPGAQGYPAPEGVHRDGFDLLAILCVAFQRARGAETSLYLSEGETPIFRAILAPGQLLLVDDPNVLHYTSPIQAEAGADGFRDVVIFTLNAVRDVE